MNKKYIIFLILLIIPIAYSEEYDWLVSKQSNNNWNNNIQDTSLALMALKDSEYISDDDISWLETKMNSCMQTETCSIKDASLALTALTDPSETLTNLQIWLSTASIFQYAGEKQGWNAQIISTMDGNCIISDPAKPSTEITVTVTAGFTPWEDISGLISETTSSIKIDCSSLPKAPTAISLIRQAGNTYYINKEVTNQKQAILNLGYPCWGTNSQDLTCNKESTAYALLVTNKDPKWLENQESLTPLQNAILHYRVTYNTIYLTRTLEAQNQFGYWGSANVYETALIYSLIPDSDEKIKAATWINRQKAEDEICWPKPKTGCKVRPTAAVLYSQAFTETESDIGGTTGDGCDEDNPCAAGYECVNEICQISSDDGNNRGRSGDSCDEDNPCAAGYECVNEICQRRYADEDYGVDCFENPGDHCITEDGYDGTCDNYGQCIKNTATEEDCYDLGEGASCTTYDGSEGICNKWGECESLDTSSDGTTEKPKKDEEEGSSVLFWFLMVLLLLIILVGGGYLAYKKGLIKFKKTTKKKPGPLVKTPFRHPLSPASQIPQRRPLVAHPVKKRISRDLDKSIREMEKYLKGKKKK